MLIKVKVKPDSNKRKIIKKSENELIVKIKSKPIQGKANEEVKKILSNYFNVSNSKVRIKRGFKRRNKIFEIIEK